MAQVCRISWQNELEPCECCGTPVVAIRLEDPAGKWVPYTQVYELVGRWPSADGATFAVHTPQRCQEARKRGAPPVSVRGER
jgi:hypothetical protein